MVPGSNPGGAHQISLHLQKWSDASHCKAASNAVFGDVCHLATLPISLPMLQQNRLSCLLFEGAELRPASRASVCGNSAEAFGC